MPCEVSSGPVRAESRRGLKGGAPVADTPRIMGILHPRPSAPAALCWALLSVLAIAPAVQAQARLTVRDTLVSARAAELEDDLSPRERARLQARRGVKPDQPLPRVRQPILPADGGFEVVVETDSPEYMVFGDGTAESIFLRVISSRDGYLTLLSGGTGPGYTVLAPNDLLAQVPIKAREPLRFPLPIYVYQGIELKPQLPQGLAQQQQSIIAIVTTRPTPVPLFDPLDPRPEANGATLSVRLFQTWLGRIPVPERGVGQAIYLVTRQ